MNKQTKWYHVTFTNVTPPDCYSWECYLTEKEYEKLQKISNPETRTFIIRDLWPNVPEVWFAQATPSPIKDPYEKFYRWKSTWDLIKWEDGFRRPNLKVKDPTIEI